MFDQQLALPRYLALTIGSPNLIVQNSVMITCYISMLVQWLGVVKTSSFTSFLQQRHFQIFLRQYTHIVPKRGGNLHKHDKQSIQPRQGHENGRIDESELHDTTYICSGILERHQKLISNLPSPKSTLHVHFPSHHSVRHSAVNSDFLNVRFGNMSIVEIVSSTVSSPF